MLLSGDEIKKRNLIQNDSTDSYRAASYDLRVGKIITWSGEEKSSFTLKSQATVLAISSERVKLPRNVSGDATVKTRLCHDGVLAINIGIIDPEYEGLVSSYLINFGRKDFSLNVGQTFLRLALHEFTPSEKPPSPHNLSDTEYINERKKETVAVLSETFLHLPMNIKPLTEEVLSEWKKGLFIWVPIASLFFIALTWAITLGVTYSGREVPSKEQLKAELSSDIQARSLKSIDDRLTRIEERLTKLEQTASGPPQPAPSPSVPQLGKKPTAGETPTGKTPTP